MTGAKLARIIAAVDLIPPLRLQIQADSIYRTVLRTDGIKEQDPLIGQKIGSYVVERLLGKGGMGAVYELFHAGIGRRMALKVLHPQFTHNESIVQRFFAEARAANVIHHPNIVDITDLNQLPNGSYYILMEFLKGESMARLLKRERMLAPEDVVHLIKPICEALEAAHQVGVVHRDLKPDNIQLVPQPGNPRFVKVLDFGIAKLSVELKAGEPATRTNMIMGTPEYMSPEQGAGRVRDVDHRTDIYALGVIMFEMFAGRAPFKAPTMFALVEMHVRAPPPPLEDFRQDLSPVWTQVVHKALAKRREDRFQSMLELRDAVESALASPQSMARPHDAHEQIPTFPGGLAPIAGSGQYARAGSAGMPGSGGLAQPQLAAYAQPTDIHGPTTIDVARHPKDLISRPWFIPLVLIAISAITAVTVLFIVRSSNATDSTVAGAQTSTTIHADANRSSDASVGGVPVKASIDAGAPDASVPDASVPDARPVRTTSVKPVAKSKRGTAKLWVTARPYARIYINGKYKGDTNKHVTIPADTRVRIRLENPDQGKQKKFSRRVAAGEKANISWNFFTDSE